MSIVCGCEGAPRKKVDVAFEENRVYFRLQDVCFPVFRRVTALFDTSLQPDAGGETHISEGIHGRGRQLQEAQRRHLICVRYRAGNPWNSEEYSMIRFLR